MGRQEEINPEVVYGNVSKFFSAGDYEKALSNARKLGRYDRNDMVAQQCIAVCCLQLDRFEDCLEVIEKKKLSIKFEKAYSLYRMHRTQESLAVLSDSTDLNTREKELLAQIFYRLEDFDKCISVYDDLLKNVHDDHDEERLSNYTAALAAREQFLCDKRFPTVVQNINSSPNGATYELLYNQACGYAACGDFGRAKTLLDKSVQEFKDSNAEDLSEEELNQELALMRTQIAYVLQMEGKHSAALEVYNQANKSSSDDPGIAAVVATNLITLSKNANVFDNKKKIKTITAPAGRQKLSSVQKKLIDYNVGLFYLNNNQIDACRKALGEFTQNYENDSYLLPLLTVAVMLRDKKYKEAVYYLNDYPHLDLLTAQVYVQQGTLTSAVNTLKTCSKRSSMAIVSSLVSLYLSFEEVTSAEEVIEEFLKSASVSCKQSNKTVLIGISEELIERGLYSKAIVYLEKLLQIQGPQPEVLAQLVTCSSKVDTSLVKKYSKDLISIEQLVKECDVNELSKSTDLFLTNKYALKKAAKTAANNATGDTNLVAKKNKRKKKAKLPANFDPNVLPDPERWLPKWERSTFRKSKKKKAHDVGKGTQGGTSGGSVYDHSGPKSTVNVPHQSTPAESPKSATGARPKTSQSKRRGGKKR